MANLPAFLIVIECRTQASDSPAGPRYLQVDIFKGPTDMDNTTRFEKLEREIAELRRENAELRRKSAERIEKLERENADLRTQLARKLCREAGCVIASSQDECSICMEENVEVAVQACKHTFHALCLSKWINQRHGTCPNCRGCLQPSSPKTT